jgi:hypothetical protein
MRRVCDFEFRIARPSCSVGSGAIVHWFYGHCRGRFNISTRLMSMSVFPSLDLLGRCSHLKYLQ